MRKEDPLEPPAVPVPPIPGKAQDAPQDDGAGAQAPMDVIGTSRKRSAEEAGHETDDADRGGVQSDPGSMAGDSMHEAMRDAGALGADAVALADAYSPARFRTKPFRLQLSLMMTGPRSLVVGDDEVLMLSDISRAHLHSPHARVVFVTINAASCSKQCMDRRMREHHSTERRCWTRWSDWCAWVTISP